MIRFVVKILCMLICASILSGFFPSGPAAADFRITGITAVAVSHAPKDYNGINNALDANINTFWHPDAQWGEERWAILDLGDDYFLNGIICYPAYPSVIWHIENMAIYGSNDESPAAGGRWTKICEIPSGGGAYPWNFHAETLKPYRYIKLYKEMGDLLISEIEFYQADNRPDQPAFSVAGASGGGSGMENVLYDDASYWQDTVTDYNMQKQIVLDMSESRYFSKIKLHIPFKNCSYHLEGAMIFGSDSPDFQQNGKTLLAEAPDVLAPAGTAWSSALSSDTPYRYIMICKTGDFLLRYIEVFEGEPGTPAADIAFGKTITAVSHGEAEDAAAILSGAEHWACSGADVWGQEKWAVIDLGKAYVLKYAQLILPYPQVPEHIQDMYIFGSNDSGMPAESSFEIAHVPRDWGAKPSEVVNGWTDAAVWAAPIGVNEAYRYIKVYKPRQDLMLKQIKLYASDKPAVAAAHAALKGNRITLGFNAAMDPRTLNSTNIKVISLSDGLAMPLDFTYTDTGKCEVELTGGRSGAAYQLVVSTGVKAIGGRPVAAVYTIAFRPFFITGSFDGSGEKADSLAPDSPAGITYFFRNTQGETREFALILALVKDGVLTKVRMDRREVGDSPVRFTAGLTTPENVEGTVARAYFWDWSAINPIAYDSAAGGSIYVDPNGSDENPGTKNSPLKTIKAAQQAAQGMLAGMESDVVVRIGGGVYPLEEPLLFTEEDAGKNGYRVVYQAERGMSPVLSGGRRILPEAWTALPGGLMKTVINDGKAADIRELYVNGKRRIRARNAMTITSAGIYCEGGEPAGIRVRKDRLPEIQTAAFAEIVYPAVEWRDYRLPVMEITEDEENGEWLVRLKKEVFDDVIANYGNILDTQPFYIENAPELADEAGEFFYNRQTKELFYLPEESESLDDVYYPRINQLVSIKGGSSLSESIVFDGIHFMHSAWSAPSFEGYYGWQAQEIRAPGSEVEFSAYAKRHFVSGAVRLENARGIAFKNCVFKNLAAVGLSLMENVSNTSVRGCVFDDIGNSAVTVGHTYQKDSPETLCSNIDIRNNAVHAAGASYAMAPGIQVYYTKGVRIAHNFVSNLPGAGICLGWGWANPNTTMSDNRIENNFVFNIAKSNRDTAGIYTLGANYPGGPSYITGNYIREQIQDYSALYNDEGSGYFIVAENVSENVPGWLYHWTDSIHHVTARDNYSTSQNTFTALRSKDSDIEPVKYHPNGDWPASALEIIEKAGPETEYRGLMIPFLPEGL